ncbi:MAG: diadenylate cyclase CdaA [Oscillospiraceae bacterium]|nr:diadenylate cyclase CdaA [Oscillospiraceae bacterium]MBR2927842.1 diadenylate cyclase CdaA [Oscillospiraceae bacterium]MBR6677797.1 diadenylate cyclase CdaA [Oscillospiraceae bacterium]
MLVNMIRYLKFGDVLDIVIMAFLIYKLLGFVRNTSSSNLIKGVALLLFALWLSMELELHGLNFILGHLVEYGLLGLIILFQPEIRKMLERVGSQRFGVANLFGKQQPASMMESAIVQTVLACEDMSRTRTGALIVFEREMNLDEMVRSGTTLDAEVSSELLKNIFFVKAPMHDGAVIMRYGRVLAAGCMLPLSTNVNLSRELGMRHRAGIGMSENADSVVVIVSEETGGISVAIGGMLKRHLKPETLENILRNELLPQDGAEKDEPEWKKLWTQFWKKGANDHESD